MLKLITVSIIAFICLLVLIEEASLFIWRRYLSNHKEAGEPKMERLKSLYLNHFKKKQKEPFAD